MVPAAPWLGLGAWGQWPLGVASYTEGWLAPAGMAAMQPMPGARPGALAGSQQGLATWPARFPTTQLWARLSLGQLPLP